MRNGDDFNKTWDSIPSLNLEMDEEYEKRLKEKEIRRHDRADFWSLKHLLDRKQSIPVRIGTAKKGTFDGKILDLSPNGLQVAIPARLDPNERIKIGFIIIGQTILANAVARWTKEKDKGYVSGLEFHGIPQKDRELLEKLSTASLMRRVGAPR